MGFVLAALVGPLLGNGLWLDQDRCQDERVRNDHGEAVENFSSHVPITMGRLRWDYLSVPALIRVGLWFASCLSEGEREGRPRQRGRFFAPARRR